MSDISFQPPCVICFMSCVDYILQVEGGDVLRRVEHGTHQVSLKQSVVEPAAKIGSVAYTMVDVRYPV